MTLLEYLKDNNITEWKDEFGKGVRIVSTSYNGSHPILVAHLDDYAWPPVLYMYSEDGVAYDAVIDKINDLAPIPHEDKIVWVLDVTVPDVGDPFHASFPTYSEAVMVADIYRARSYTVKMYRIILHEDNEVKA